MNSRLLQLDRAKEVTSAMLRAPHSQGGGSPVRS